MTCVPDPLSTSLLFFRYIHCVCELSEGCHLKGRWHNSQTSLLPWTWYNRVSPWMYILLNDSGAGVLSSSTEALLCSFSWRINIPFPLPSTGAQTLLWFCVIPHCLPTGQLSSDERLIRSMLSGPLLLQSLSDLRKYVHPVYSLAVRVGHLGSPFKQLQVLPCWTFCQQHKQLQKGKWGGKNL